ncbi:hypothetical protein [Pseudomonas aeruginosa]|uniref:hypothetical protein n=1 Tax=Pseudomonas aeruginosa TaxID=287 RepID=UPI001A9F135F|nr:hypothetical protein [Pseudomonas aeruginosa]
MARLDPALAEEIRRLPISRRLELTQALLHRAGLEVERQWLRVAEDRLADCRAGTADALPRYGRRCRWAMALSAPQSLEHLGQRQRALTGILPLPLKSATIPNIFRLGSGRSFSRPPRLRHAHSIRKA